MIPFILGKLGTLLLHRVVRSPSDRPAKENVDIAGYSYILEMTALSYSRRIKRLQELAREVKKGKWHEWVRYGRFFAVGG